MGTCQTGNITDHYHQLEWQRFKTHNAGFTIEPLPMVQRKCSRRMEASLAHSHHWHPHSPGIHHTLSNRILGFHPHLFSNCYNPMFFPILNFTRLHLFPISNHLYTAWETIKEINIKVRCHWSGYVFVITISFAHSYDTLASSHPHRTQMQMSDIRREECLRCQLGFPPAVLFCIDLLLTSALSHSGCSMLPPQVLWHSASVCSQITCPKGKLLTISQLSQTSIKKHQRCPITSSLPQTKPSPSHANTSVQRCC